MTVSFTGMQNIGANLRGSYSHPQDFLSRIAIQLNNNGEKDLDAFKPVLEKYSDCLNSTFLDVIFDSKPNKLNPKKPYLDMFINTKKVEMTNENLPIFKKINNLLKRIALGEEETPTKADYLQSENCNDRYFSELYGLEHKPKTDLIKDLHDIDWVGAVSNTTSKVLSKSIKYADEFGVKESYKEVLNLGGFHYANLDKEVDRFFFELNEKDREIFLPFFKTKNPFESVSKKLMVDLHKDITTQITSIKLNNMPLTITDENFPAVRKVVQLLKEIKCTDKELPFPKDYLSDESFNEISKWVLKTDELKKKYNTGWEDKMDQEFELDLISDDQGAQAMADKIASAFDKKIIAFFS